MAGSTHPERLRSLANILDRALGGLDAPHGALVFVSGGPDPTDDDPVDLGVKDLHGDHPVSHLLGFTAPSDWQVLGVVASGRCYRYDDPDPEKTPSSVVFLADRHGGSASLLRTAESVTPIDDEPVGTIPDCLRRALGLPTAPPDCSPGVLFATLWLDRLLDAAGTPEGRAAIRDWEGIAALHPASTTAARARPWRPADLATATRDLVRRWSWSRVRTDAERWSLPSAAAVAPDVAAWMDDGMFSRWTLGGLPHMRTLVRELGPLLADEHAEPIVSVIEAALQEAA